MAPLPLVVLSGLLLMLSGCSDLAGGSSISMVSISGQGQKTGQETKALSCGSGSGTVSLGGQGEGSLTVMVRDAAGQEIFRKEFRGREQATDATTVDGVPGQWSLVVDFGAALGIGAWNGQYAITLMCIDSSAEHG